MDFCSFWRHFLNTHLWVTLGHFTVKKPANLGREIPGGALTLERGMGICRGHDPLFSDQSPLPSHKFTVNVPLLCPLFSIFRKFLHFQPCFGQNSSSLDPNFSKFSFLRPLFFKKNPLPRPYILKPAWHTSTKKKVECPPPGGNLYLTKNRFRRHEVWCAADNHNMCHIYEKGFLDLYLNFN